jgi:hypothetical protein
MNYTIKALDPNNSELIECISRFICCAFELDPDDQCNGLYFWQDYKLEAIAALNAILFYLAKKEMEQKNGG